MRWTKMDSTNRFYVIVQKEVFLFDIIERISEFETEMNIPELERWTKGNSVRCNAFNHVYELIQRLGALEDEIPRFRQRKKIHDRIQAAMNKN